MTFFSRIIVKALSGNVSGSSLMKKSKEAIISTEAAVKSITFVPNS